MRDFVISAWVVGMAVTAIDLVIFARRHPKAINEMREAATRHGMPRAVVFPALVTIIVALWPAVWLRRIAG